MNKTSMLLTGVALSVLAACGGTTVDDVLEEVGEFRLSSGVLDEIDVPTGENLDDLPTFVADLIGDFEDLNEDFAPTTTLPPGGADYSGSLGFQVDDQDTYLLGALDMRAEFDDLTFNGTYSDISGTSEDGQTLDVIGSVPVMTTIRTDGDSITFDGTIFGTVMLEDETFAFNGLIDGGFGGTDAEVAVAEISGNVGDDEGSDEIFGLVTLTQD